MPVDTLHPDQFFGQKPVMKAPFAWEDWYGLIACSFLALPLLGLLIYLIVRIRDNKPIIRKIKVEPKLPPHQAAMKEIERIKTEKVWQKGQSKEYYTELTDAIRTYIKDRFGFNALEMTSSEIIDQLLEMNDKEATLCSVRRSYSAGVAEDQNTLLCSRRSGAYKKCRINGKDCQKNWLQNAAGTEGFQ